MTAPVFVDTSVLVYTRDSGAGKKNEAAQAAECGFLLSEDFQAGQELGEVRVIK